MRTIPSSEAGRRRWRHLRSRRRKKAYSAAIKMMTDKAYWLPLFTYVNAYGFSSSSTSRPSPTSCRASTSLSGSKRWGRANSVACLCRGKRRPRHWSGAPPAMTSSGRRPGVVAVHPVGVGRALAPAIGPRGELHPRGPGLAVPLVALQGRRRRRHARRPRGSATGSRHPRSPSRHPVPCRVSWDGRHRPAGRRCRRPNAPMDRDRPAAACARRDTRRARAARQDEIPRTPRARPSTSPLADHDSRLKPGSGWLVTK